MVSYPGKKNSNLIFSHSHSMSSISPRFLSPVPLLFSSAPLLTQRKHTHLYLFCSFFCMHTKNKKIGKLIWADVFFSISCMLHAMHSFHHSFLSPTCAGKIGDENFSLLPIIGVPLSHLNLSGLQKYYVIKVRLCSIKKESMLFKVYQIRSNRSWHRKVKTLLKEREKENTATILLMFPVLKWFSVIGYDKKRSFILRRKRRKKNNDMRSNATAVF